MVSLSEKTAKPNQAVIATPAGIQIPISNKKVINTNNINAITVILKESLQNRQRLNAPQPFADNEAYLHVVL